MFKEGSKYTISESTLKEGTKTGAKQGQRSSNARQCNAKHKKSFQMKHGSELIRMTVKLEKSPWNQEKCVVYETEVVKYFV